MKTKHRGSVGTYLLAVIQYIHLVFETGGFRGEVRLPAALLRHVLWVVRLLSVHARIAQQRHLRLEMANTTVTDRAILHCLKQEMRELLDWVAFIFLESSVFCCNKNKQFVKRAC